ncbi:hypothetical protein AB0J86_13000 [Micromonospora sp. NPDC049559]|uniref:hypothetical protein n=1 Tax=Micromonospora sp. NPDC049559 TaxID=3155923 RepID=UPI0034494565
MPKPGDTIIVDGRASVQFAGDRALLFRVVSVPDWATYHGWCWLVGYVLDRTGQAVERRQIFVQTDGLRLPPPPRKTPPPTQAPTARPAVRRGV